MIDYDVKVGERIRLLREQKGLSQTQLAIRVGYEGRTAISKVEKGERKIQVELIPKFAEVLGTTPEYLMGWKEEPISPAMQALIDDVKTLSDEECKQITEFLAFVTSKRK